MRRGVLVAWHVLSVLIAGLLFFLYVLPRWSELAGQLSPTTGTVLRIVTGLLVASTAAPVFLDLAKRRPPEFGTPQLSLGLHVWSIAGQVVAGLLIVVLAITEIWVSLDRAGQILFGGYAAAAALAVLSAIAFYLSFAAETTPAPPKPPKPLKPKKADQPEAAVEAEADEGVESDSGGLRNRRPGKPVDVSAVED